MCPTSAVIDRRLRMCLDDHWTGILVVSWYWESERGRCSEDAPDSFKSTAHSQGVCDARLCAAEFAGLVAAGLDLQINTEKKEKVRRSQWGRGTEWPPLFISRTF